MPGNAHTISTITSLVASNDVTRTVYFWQLYSILGEHPIRNLITAFYSKIFTDDRNIWVRDAFVELGSLDYRIKGQLNFWIDVMGGGPRYRSEKVLSYKHKHVSHLMTEAGANLWMKYMVSALYEVNVCRLQDKRIVPCISEFICYFMLKYSKEFDFNLYGYNARVRPSHM